MHRLIALLAFAAACGAPQPSDVDFDEDGFTADVDCNDGDPAVHPDATEVCNGVDDDCDGTADGAQATDPSTFYADQDGDGHGAGSAITACEQPASTSAVDDDCNDSNPAIHPGASEADCTDPTDYNCDGSTGYADADGDGFAACEDCNDDDSSIKPGASETCDGVDENCNGAVDENATDQATWYADGDGDGYGSAVTVKACTQPTGFTDKTGDCNDAAATAFPGGTEVCDRVDNNCDGKIDSGASDASTWYRDGDGDGFGDVTSSVPACDAPTGYVADDSDCDDAEASVHPGGIEICDEYDNDCDGTADNNPAVGTTYFKDGDGDGWGLSSTTAVACGLPSGYSSKVGDCNDGSASVYPGAAEACNRVDDDCDGSIDDNPTVGTTTSYRDADGDGYGDPSHGMADCTVPTGYVTDSSDCDDLDDTAFPGGTEICDEVDNDCDGNVDVGAVDTTVWYQDGDGDGAGRYDVVVEACDAPSGYVDNALDCEDDKKGTIDCDPRYFYTCGATGRTGPTSSACDTTYKGTSLEGEVSVASGIQEWVVPRTATYRLYAWGAAGVSATSTYRGGYGAYVSALYDLEAGDVLYIAVGQMGKRSGAADTGSGGGGGATWILDADGNPLVVAGGGGGTRAAAARNGCDGQAGNYATGGSGSSSSYACTVKTTDKGLGGKVSSTSYGSGGAGYGGNGADDSSYGTGGRSWANGLGGGEDKSGCVGGGAEGGFGGGGAGAGCWGGGGGGGYSGGDGGLVAGGGGSYYTGTGASTASASNSGAGFAYIIQQ